MARTVTRTCAACGRELRGKKLDAAIYSHHTGNYYCGPREPCHTRRPRKPRAAVASSV